MTYKSNAKKKDNFFYSTEELRKIDARIQLMLFAYSYSPKFHRSFVSRFFVGASVKTSGRERKKRVEENSAKSGEGES